jgi:outer membrane protein assembly factor BamA
VREIRWEGNQVLSAMELANRVSLQAGAVANTVQLQRDLDTIRGEEYGGRGYILAQLRIVPELDDAARTADLVVQVNEGDQFRFQSLVIEGLPPTAVAELNRRWKLKPGEPYNNVYAEKFIREEVAAVVKRLSAQPLSLTYSLARDDEQSTVTVWIRFR